MVAYSRAGKSRGWFALAAAGALALLIAGCSRGSSTDPESTPAETATPSPEASPAPGTPAGQASPGGTIEVASTVKLVDAATGAVETLYEDRGTEAWDAFFEGDRILVRAGANLLEFALDGSAVATRDRAECRESNGAVEIAGRRYSGISCGVISPDGRWMTYHVDAGETTLPMGLRVPLWDQWLVNLETGSTRLLQAGLVHCGGCDSRYGPRWSPGSRFVVYAEFGGSQRRFLSDALTGATRPLGAGADIGLAPKWAPGSEQLLYSSAEGGRTVLEDLAVGSVRELDLAWPAAFDTSGTLVYSPAWAPDGKGTTDVSTTVIQAASGKRLATLPGAPPYMFVWSGSAAVAAGPDGVLAVLQQASGCAGTAIYLGGKLQRCVEGGMEGQIGPNGNVAVARKTGEAGRAAGPGFETLSIDTFSVVLVAAGKQPQTVVKEALSFHPPLMVWSEDAAQLLILWPRRAGL